MSGKQPQVVVVTGASGGIGRAIAHAFARHGAHIGVLARGREALDQVVEEVESFGGQALAVTTDVSEHAQIEAAAVEVEERFGPIDVWVNDAMATVFAQFIHLEPEEFKRATEVTYLGTVYGTMVALSRMKPRDHGTIVQVGSALAYRAIPLQAAYCGSKFAIRGFTDSVRVELMHDRSKVRLTMVQLPGSTRPSSTGAVPRCPTTRSRCRRSTSQRSPPRPFTGPLSITGVRCGSARARCWRVLGNRLGPSLADRYLAITGFKGQQMQGKPVSPDRRDNLFEPLPQLAATHGIFDDKAKTRSPQMWMATHRPVVFGALAGLAAAAAGVARVAR